VKLAWGRVHAALAVKVGLLQARLGRGCVRAQSDDDRATRHRPQVPWEGNAADAMPPAQSLTVERPLSRVTFASRAARRNDVMQAALATLRLPNLPPAPPSSRVERLNPFSLNALEHNPALAAYWRNASQAFGDWSGGGSTR